MKKVKINENIKKQMISIALRGIYEANYHIDVLKTKEYPKIYVHGGIWIKLIDAVKRRKHCIKMVKQALKGYLY